MFSLLKKNHYSPQLKTHVRFDASTSGLSTAIKQLTIDSWKTIFVDSGLLNVNEVRSIEIE